VRSDTRLRHRPTARLHCGAFGGRRRGGDHGRCLSGSVRGNRRAFWACLWCGARPTLGIRGHEGRWRSGAEKRAHRARRIEATSCPGDRLPRRQGYHGQPQQRRCSRCPIGPGRVAQEAGRKRLSREWARVQPHTACRCQRRNGSGTMGHSSRWPRLVGWQPRRILHPSAGTRCHQRDGSVLPRAPSSARHAPQMIPRAAMGAQLDAVAISGRSYAR
jgi:hypothetical protein